MSTIPSYSEAPGFMGNGNMFSTSQTHTVPLSMATPAAATMGETIEKDISLEMTVVELRRAIANAKQLYAILCQRGQKAQAQMLGTELINAVREPYNWDPSNFSNAVFQNIGDSLGMATIPESMMDSRIIPADSSVFPKSMDINAKLRKPLGDEKDRMNRRGKKNAPPYGSKNRGFESTATFRKPCSGWDAALPPEFNEPEVYAFVEFKRGRIRKYASVPDIQPGSYVIVDGDRGQDCGLLVQTIRKIPGQEDQVICMEDTYIEDRAKVEDGRVIRVANEEDVKRLHTVISNAEQLALSTCRERCKSLNIEIDLLDVEYQFDMKKVSFFFDSDHSVDFRDLVRDLYRSFGARIWMENVNPKVRNSVADASNNTNNGTNWNEFDDGQRDRRKNA